MISRRQIIESQQELVRSAGLLASNEPNNECNRRQSSEYNDDQLDRFGQTKAGKLSRRHQDQYRSPGEARQKSSSTGIGTKVLPTTGTNGSRLERLKLQADASSKPSKISYRQAIAEEEARHGKTRTNKQSYQVNPDTVSELERECFRHESSQELGGQQKSSRAYLKQQRNKLEADQTFEEQDLSQQQQQQRFMMKQRQVCDQPNYRHFDPYSVYGEEDEEEDVWYSEERLFEDHIQEIIDKWLAIDDEIWAKIICLERNRRIAKAYARKHTLTVNGSQDEYLDGTTLGLNSFDNPDRDSKTQHIKQYIGQGLRIKITQNGDILVKRISKANIYFHRLNQGSASDSYMFENSVSSGDTYGVVGLAHRSRIISPYSSSFITGKQSAGNRLLEGTKKMANPSSDASTSSSSGVAMSAGSSSNMRDNKEISLSSSTARLASDQLTSSVALEYNRAFKIFDMNKFKGILERESRRPCPNRRRLQSQCISVISFVVDDQKMLNLPSWIMIINIVAIELLKSEIGLIDSQDLFGQPAPPPFDVSLAPSFGPTGSDHQLAAASKRAFASAAASGAYNGDHYGHLHLSRSHASHHLNIETNRELADELQRRRLKQSELSLPNPSEALQQSSGSSSGFNSQCSSQEESLAASSHSNNTTNSSNSSESSTAELITHLNSGDEDSTESSEDQLEAMKGDKQGNKKLSTSQQIKQDLEIRAELSAAAIAAAATPRGRRPPKLPHRLGSPAVKMSEPIPIPAPPTSAGADATGTANLILVSPTGLSPPSHKRKNAICPNSRWLSTSASDCPGSQVLKQLEESIQKQSRQHLPAGIPAHAQLAPPATQRHILKYLMSASNRCDQVGASPMVPAPPMRYQRPLPIVPVQQGHNMVRQCQEENLYYCGLQARVSAGQRRNVNQRPKMMSPVLQSSSFNIQQQQALHKSAINAILSDYRNRNISSATTLSNPTSYRVGGPQGVEVSRQQSSLNNLKDPNFYLRFYETGNNPNNLRKPAKPLITRLFNRSAAQAHPRTQATGMEESGARLKGLFLSADNLHQTPLNAKASSSSILDQIGLKLRKSKTKKKLESHLADNQ